MEHEKKNPPSSGDSAAHKKHRPNHRRGYFIEPTVPTPVNAVPTTFSVPAEKAEHETKVAAPSDKTSNRKEPANNDINRGANTKSAKNHRRTRTKNNSSKEVSEQNRSNTPQPRQNHASKTMSDKNHTGGSKDNNTKGKSSHFHTATKRISDPSVKNRPEPLNENDYEEVRFPEAEPFSAHAVKKEEEKDVPLVEVVGIRFKSTGKVYYFSPGNNRIRRGEHAIVETARGQEYGEVTMSNTMVKESDTVPPLRAILRVATKEDQLHYQENRLKEEEAFQVCNEKIRAHGLDMKLIDAQYTFDNSKLLFYFTSSGRVDFRDLVKDLASVFRTRIELRQIGIRDEAKLMGGMGMCGRPLCCTLFLSDFGQVSIKMAKEQNLSLNSTKISGICGRLMCCLRYEHETYEYEIKRTPPVDSLVRTADGNGIVTEIAPLAGTVKVRLLASPEAPPKVYKREDITMLQKKKNKSETDNA